MVVNGTSALRIQAGDLAKAKLELPKIIAESGLTLLRYELTLPSLEDIFIELIDNGGND
ncbi:MAG: hypothetical protein PHQ86_02890 [Dehalococcoidales bacterium]|nr:hypothetical protein [Dehalococcoidales bacterium]